jgi:hypothetical protein
MRAILTISAFCAFTALGAQPQKCVNPATEWTINPLYVDGTSAAIQGDGAPYVDGQSGNAAVINVCSGTYDATLNMGATRTATFSFAGLLASNSITPSWALDRSTITGSSFMNVRNLWFVPPEYDRSMEYTFTTRMNASIPVKGSYALHFIAANPDAPSSAPNTSVANIPYPDSLVIVHHCPAGVNSNACPNVSHETWFVYPDTNQTASGTSQTDWPITQVGTLLNTQTSPAKNAGEFSVSFSFTISLLQ